MADHIISPHSAIDRTPLSQCCAARCERLSCSLGNNVNSIANNIRSPIISANINTYLNCVVFVYPFSDHQTQYILQIYCGRREVVGLSLDCRSRVRECSIPRCLPASRWARHCCSTSSNGHRLRQFQSTLNHNKKKCLRDKARGA